MTIKNEYKVKKLVYKARAFVYCPLGNDWGAVDIEAEIRIGSALPDYNDIDRFVLDKIDNHEYISEEVGFLVYDFIKNTVEGATVTVRIHSNNNSVHECYTTIGDAE